MIKRHETSKRMSKAVINNGVAYLCGQVAKEYKDDIKDQTQRTLNNIETILEDIGSNKDNLLSVTIYLRDKEDFAEMNKVWEDWLDDGCAPARTTVCVEFPNPEIKIEMTVTARIV